MTKGELRGWLVGYTNNIEVFVQLPDASLDGFTIHLRVDDGKPLLIIRPDSLRTGKVRPLFL